MYNNIFFVFALKASIFAATISPFLSIGLKCFHFKYIHDDKRIPEDIITRTIGLILLSGYSNNFFISSMDGGLS
jgi:hypothetical protein